MADVAITGLPLEFPYSGTAVYARNLLPLLPQVAPDLACRLIVRHPVDPAPLPAQAVTTPFSGRTGQSRIAARADKLAWEAVCVPIAAARDSLIHFLYFAAPPLAASPVVVTVHDLIPLAVPGHHRHRQAAAYSRFMGWTVRRCAAIITVSNHSRMDILRLLRVPEKQVHVTYEAVDERFCQEGDPEEGERLRATYGLPERFLLYVGGAERRKNLETLLRAYGNAVHGMRDRGVKLVVVAHFPPPDPLYPDMPGLAASLGLENDTVFVPGVEEVDKPALYRAALAFCFPSRYEGFGFPPLEAMACGTPVVSSDASSLSEVLDGGALLLPADDVAAWSEALLHVIDSGAQRRRLSTAGKARAEEYSWRKTAEGTAAIYREILGR